TEDVLLIISDSASYMIKAISQLKNVYVNMNHISCIAYLAHNCALKIKAKYKRADLLISSIKAITVRNHTNRNIFNEIEPIPFVIVTRWSSWLSGALYYARNLPQIKKLMLKVEFGRILAEKAKIACLDTLLVTELFEVKKNYESLISFIDKLEKGLLAINTGVLDILILDLGDDPLFINDYIKYRLEKTDFFAMEKMLNPNISPEDYLYFSNCPPTSISVEIGFSMLRRMLRIKRHFKMENIEAYFVSYYNTRERVDSLEAASEDSSFF
ncbi:hypothetical protein CDIK_4485, partial [Cucumispora dikerogammari]